jgi:signal transduction histidine kinase
MQLSIRTRMIVGLNVLIIAVAVSLGYLAARVASETLEQRLVSEVARNTTGFLAEQHYPLSDTLMSHLKSMFDLDFVAVGPPARPEVLGTSLDDQATTRLLARVRSGDRAGRLQVGSRELRFESAPLVRELATGGGTRRFRLYALAGAQQFQAASRQAAGKVGLIAALAALAATLVGAGLSWTIARPIRRLADRMDTLAEAPDTRVRADEDTGGPSEVVRLRRSFNHLLDQLAAAQQHLARSQQLAVLGKLSASVAHELRNPLSGMKMHLRLLADEIASDEGRESLDTVLREAQRMELYLSDLMEMAAGGGEIGSDQPTGETSCEVGEVIETTLGLMRPRLRHAGIELNVEVSGDLPPAAIAAQRLGQVVLNLLVNAAEAMGSGGTLTLRAIGAREQGAGPTVTIEVLDTGPGIDPAEAEEIFEPFVSTKPRSAGLGLYLCRRIVEGRGGRIEVRKAPGGGARMVVTLPAAQQGDRA